MEQAARASPGAANTDWTISTIRSFIVIYCAYVFVYILNTVIDLGTFCTKKNIINILPGSPEKKKKQSGYMLGTFHYLLLKRLKMCFRIHVNYILDVFIEGDLD